MTRSITFCGGHLKWQYNVLKGCNMSTESLKYILEQMKGLRIVILTASVFWFVSLLLHSFFQNYSFISRINSLFLIFSKRWPCEKAWPLLDCAQLPASKYPWSGYANEFRLDCWYLCLLPRVPLSPRWCTAWSDMTPLHARWCCTRGVLCSNIKEYTVLTPSGVISDSPDSLKQRHLMGHMETVNVWERRQLPGHSSVPMAHN